MKIIYIKLLLLSIVALCGTHSQSTYPMMYRLFTKNAPSSSKASRKKDSLKKTSTKNFQTVKYEIPSNNKGDTNNVRWDQKLFITNWLNESQESYDNLEKQAFGHIVEEFLKKNSTCNEKEIKECVEVSTSSFFKLQKENIKKLTIDRNLVDEKMYSNVIYDLPDNISTVASKWLYSLGITPDIQMSVDTQHKLSVNEGAVAFAGGVIFSDQLIKYNYIPEIRVIFLTILFHELTHVVRNHCNSYPVYVPNEKLRLSTNSLDSSFNQLLGNKDSEFLLAMEHNADMRMFFNQNIDTDTLKSILQTVYTMRNQLRPSACMSFKKLYEEGSTVVRMREYLEKLQKLD